MDPDAAREHLIAERERLADVKESVGDIGSETENESISELSDVDDTSTPV